LKEGLSRSARIANVRRWTTENPLWLSNRILWFSPRLVAEPLDMQGYRTLSRLFPDIPGYCRTV
jgi:hypothetical protein